MAYSKLIQIMAQDGFEFDLISQTPKVPKPAAVIILQEIFGLTDHIHSLVSQFADAGYHTFAPALFDRVKKGTILPYDQIETGREIMLKSSREHMLLDIAATCHMAREYGKVAVIGYCWGGLVAYQAAGHMTMDCMVSFYGGRISQQLHPTPRCPSQFHFGDADSMIPLPEVEKIKTTNPGQEFYIYPAGHAFNCNDRPSYNAAAANLSHDRTLSFLQQHLAN